MFRVLNLEICIYTQDMFTDYKNRIVKEFAHEHEFKGLYSASFLIILSQFYVYVTHENEI